MKTRAGIFAGPNALGIAAFGATGTSCTPDNSGLIKGIQSYLKGHGAPNLRIDGVWQGCTASAWNKVMGHMWVTCADIKTATGLDCSSDDCGLMGVVASLSVPAMFQCTDSSDGVPAPGGGQQCPAGQAWNGTLGYCVPTAIPSVTPPVDNTQPSAGGCPAGQTGIPPLCFGTPTGGGGSQPASSGGCPAGQTGIPPLCFAIPGQQTTQAQNCPSGSVLTPAGCVSTTSPGTVTTPTPCPQGQMQLPILGTCVPNPLATTGGGGGTAAGGGCPAGQIGFPPFCVPNPMASTTTQQGQPTDILGGLTAAIGKIFGQGTSCPAGSMYNPLTQQCTGATGPVGPATVTPVIIPTSVFGNMGYVVLAALGIGVAAVGYYVYKRQGGGEGAMSDEEFQALMASEGLDGGMGGMDAGYGDVYGGAEDYGYAMNRKRRGRKSRRRGRGRRR